jgi:hypothetical protein
MTWATTPSPRLAVARWRPSFASFRGALVLTAVLAPGFSVRQSGNRGLSVDELTRLARVNTERVGPLESSVSRQLGAPAKRVVAGATSSTASLTRAHPKIRRSVPKVRRLPIKERRTPSGREEIAASPRPPERIGCQGQGSPTPRRRTYQLAASPTTAPGGHRPGTRQPSSRRWRRSGWRSAGRRMWRSRGRRLPDASLSPGDTHR